MSQAIREVEDLTLPVPGTYELDVFHTTVGFVARHMLTRVRGPVHGLLGHHRGGRAARGLVGERRDQDREHPDRHRQARRSPQERGLPAGRGVPADHVHEHGRAADRRNGFELDGDLTIKDVTKPVTLTGEYLGTGPGMDGETPMLAAHRFGDDRPRGLGRQLEHGGRDRRVPGEQEGRSSRSRSRRTRSSNEASR